MSAIITTAQLEALDACEEQLAEFRRLFPTGTAEVTVSRAKKLAQVFDWDWAAENLLTDNNAWADYEAAYASACADYKAAYASAGADYKAARASALADVLAPALAAYNAATASAGAAYKTATAEAFARAYIMQEKAK